MPIQTRSVTAKKLQPLADKFEKGPQECTSSSKSSKKGKTKVITSVTTACEKKTVSKGASKSSKNQSKLKTRNKKEETVQSLPVPSTSGCSSSTNQGFFQAHNVSEQSDEDNCKENIIGYQNPSRLDSIKENEEEIPKFRSLYSKFSTFLQMVGDPANYSLPAHYKKIKQDANERLQELKQMKEMFKHDLQLPIAQTPLGKKVDSAKGFSSSSENEYEKSNSGASLRSSLHVKPKKTSKEKYRKPKPNKHSTKIKVEVELCNGENNLLDLNIPENFSFCEKPVTQSSKKRILDNYDFVTDGPITPCSSQIPQIPLVGNNKDKLVEHRQTEDDNDTSAPAIVAPVTVLYSQLKTQFTRPRSLVVPSTTLDNKNEAAPLNKNNVVVEAATNQNQTKFVIFSNRVKGESDPANRKTALSEKIRKSEGFLKNIFSRCSTINSSTPIESLKVVKSSNTHAKSTESTDAQLPTSNEIQNEANLSVVTVTRARSSPNVNLQLAKMAAAPSEIVEENYSAAECSAADHEKKPEKILYFISLASPNPELMEPQTTSQTTALAIECIAECQVVDFNVDQNCDIDFVPEGVIQNCKTKPQQHPIELANSEVQSTTVAAQRSIDEHQEAIYLDLKGITPTESIQSTHQTNEESPTVLSSQSTLSCRFSPHKLQKCSSESCISLVKTKMPKIGKSSSPTLSGCGPMNKIDGADSDPHADRTYLYNCNAHNGGCALSSSSRKTYNISEPCTRRVTPKNDEKTISDLGKNIDGKPGKRTSVGGNNSMDSTTSTNAPATILMPTSRVVPESNLNSQGHSWYFKSNTHTPNSSTESIKIQKLQKKQMEEHQRIQKKQEESLRKKEMILQQKKTTQKLKNDEWKSKIEKKKQEDTRIQAYLTRGEDNLKYQFRAGAGGNLGGLKLKGENSTDPKTGVNGASTPSMAAVVSSSPSPASTSAVCKSNNPILRKSGLFVQKLFSSVGNSLWSKGNDKKNETPAEKEEVPLSSNRADHTFVIPTAAVAETPYIVNGYDTSMCLEAEELLNAEIGGNKTYDMNSENTYDITCYEDLDDNMQYRRQKHVPHWANDEDFLRTSLMLQQSYLMSCIRHSPFPRKNINCQMFDTTAPLQVTLAISYEKQRS